MWSGLRVGAGTHRGIFPNAPFKWSTSGSRLHCTLPRSLGADVGRRDPAPAPSTSGTSSSKHSRPGQPLPEVVEAVLKSPDLERPDGSDPLQLLRVTEAYWAALKAGKEAPVKAVIHTAEGRLHIRAEPEYDVAVCGGTLGIFLAVRLQALGHRVCIIEKRRLQGRTQEWNTSRKELGVLVEEGLLTAEEAESCVVSSFNPVRVAFKGMEEALEIRDVLNIGVSPRLLLDTLKARFIRQGGILLERTAFKAGTVYEDGVAVELLPGAGGMAVTHGDVNRPLACSAEDFAQGQGASISGSGGSGGGPAPAQKRRLTCRLLLDAMGHYSPIVAQIRGGRKPDAMVIVVGGAMSGVPPERNTSADLLCSIDDSSDDMQLFWEAFPAAGGSLRTTYMFCYTDCDPRRPSFAALLEKYLELLPQYQGVPLSQLRFQRLLYGGFPCYADNSPLAPAFDRVLQVGDASAAQSPLSFGGFGSMLRHLPRLGEGVHEALAGNRLRRHDLAWLQPYQPSLSASWLFQRAMALRVGQLSKDGQAGRQKQQQQAATSQSPAAAAVEREVASTSQPSWSPTQQQRRQTGFIPPDHINRLLRCNFSVMKLLGERVMRPFVQDTMQLGPLSLTMLGMSLRDPVCVTRVLWQVGPGLVAGWFRHFFALAAYTLAHALLAPLKRWVPSFRFRRLVDALKWGSGSDYAA